MSSQPSAQRAPTPPHLTVHEASPSVSPAVFRSAGFHEPPSHTMSLAPTSHFWLRIVQFVCTDTTNILSST